MRNDGLVIRRRVVARWTRGAHSQMRVWALASHEPYTALWLCCGRLVSCCRLYDCDLCRFAYFSDRFCSLPIDL